MSRAAIRTFLFVVGIGLSGLSCSRNSFEGEIIAVEIEGDVTGSFDGASLIAIDPEHPHKKGTIISREFESACSPDLSFDARYLLFQGKKKGDEKWQIWLMDLHTKKFRLVTDLPENCTNPASLPDGTVIFSRDYPSNGQQYTALYRCNKDGSGLSQVTFNQGKNIHPSVLGEGRVLYISSQQYPEIPTPDLMIMRPDGTKSEIYHRGSNVVYPVSRGSESGEGYIYFVNNDGTLMRILHRRPLHTAEKIAPEAGGIFVAVTALEGSECLVSWQSSPDKPAAIFKFDTHTKSAPVLVHQGEKHITNPLLVRALNERPRILPTEVVAGEPTGLIMSQDINYSMLPANPGTGDDSTATHIRVSGTDGEWAVVEVKNDGSVYLEMNADTPFRFETLNKQGETVRGPSAWIYLRPSERRACTGCHADPELAPKNIQPLAVKELPVLLSEKKK
ncbi:MAG: hypothetical protein R6W31_19990 [Bacteroidales bacterium]